MREYINIHNLIACHYISFLLLYSYYLKLVCEIPLFITVFIVAVKNGMTLTALVPRVTEIGVFDR